MSTRASDVAGGRPAKAAPPASNEFDARPWELTALGPACRTKAALVAMIEKLRAPASAHRAEWHARSQNLPRP
eukprot:5242596-Pyramimonas_sp.AAC.1